MDGNVINNSLAFDYLDRVNFIKKSENKLIDVFDSLAYDFEQHELFINRSECLHVDEV